MYYSAYWLKNLGINEATLREEFAIGEQMQWRI